MKRDRYQGVTYYDDEKLHSWIVKDTRGRCLERHASPVAERQTIVLYDDAHCRGADLQLRSQAVGLLTLGPGVSKDKLMQAAWRLRQLGRGQRLCFAAANEITAKIRQVNGLTPVKPAVLAVTEPPGHGSVVGGVEAVVMPPRNEHPLVTAEHVLRWVMHNTVQATLHGVVQWASNGLHFAATKGAPQRALLPEVLDVDALYGSSKVQQPVAEVVQAKARLCLLRCGGDDSDSGGGNKNGRGVGLSASMAQLMNCIAGRAELYGAGHYIRASVGAAGDEECERELEREEAEEQEEERQVPRAKAVREQDWQYGSALRAASACELNAAGAQLMLLRTATAQLLLPSSLGMLPWSSYVHCTKNFLVTTLTSREARHTTLNEYLRPVDAMLVFPKSGEVVLLSEREADQLQAISWGGHSQGGYVATTTPAVAPLLVNLCYARDALAHGRQLLLAVRLGGPGIALQPVPLSAEALVSVQLFDGEASYCSEVQQREVKLLVWRQRDAVEALLGMRGKSSLLPRSELERVCDEIV